MYGCSLYIHTLFSGRTSKAHKNNTVIGLVVWQSGNNNDIHNIQLKIVKILSLLLLLLLLFYYYYYYPY